MSVPLVIFGLGLCGGYSSILDQDGDESMAMPELALMTAAVGILCF